MTIRRLAFDGAVYADAGIAYSGGSPHSLVDGAGAAKSAGQPVFGPDRIVYSAPSPILLNSDAVLGKQPIAAGKWLDGVTECYVGQELSGGNSLDIDIRVGSEAAATAGNFVGRPARTKQISCLAGDTFNPGWKGALGTSRIDLLRGSGAIAGESNSYRIFPRAWHLCDGLLAGVASVWEGSGAPAADGTPTKIAFWWWDETNQRFTSTTDYHGSTVQSGRQRGEPWCMSPPWLSSDRLTSVWTFMDYRSNSGSDGFQAYCVICTRTAIGQPWTVGALQMVTEQTGLTNGHGHSMTGWIDESTGRLYIAGTVGDGLNNQRLLLITRANYATYTDGGVTFDAAATTTGNGWTCYPSMIGDTAATPKVPFSQTLSFLRVTGDPYSYIVGADETATALCRITVSRITADNPTPTATIRPVAQSLPATARNRGYVVMPCHAAQDTSNKAFIAYTDTQQRTATGEDDNMTQVLFSTDDEFFGGAVSIMADNSKQPRVVTTAGHIIVTDVSRPLLAIPVPRRIRGRPLLVPGGVTNYLRSDTLVMHVANNYLTSGNTATANPDLAALFPSMTIPPAPSQGPISYHKFAASSGTEAGLVRVCNGSVIPTNAGKIRVHGYILRLPNDSGAPGASGELAFRGIDFASVGGALRHTTITGSDQFPELPTGNMAWQPFSIDLRDPATEWTIGTGSLSNPFEMAVRVFVNSGVANRQEFLIQWTAITAGDTHLPITGPAPGNGVASAAHDGVVAFDGVGSAWTAYVLAQMPSNGWDSDYASGPANQILFTLRQSATRYLTVARSGATLVFTMTNGGSTATVTLSGPSSPFSYTWSFVRESPIAIGISYDGTTLRAAASVKNTPVSTGTASITADFRPTSLQWGDHQRANVQPMTYHRVTIDDAAAASTSTMTTALNTWNNTFPTNASTAGNRPRPRSRRTR
jgi:hypothetical protein